MVARRESLAWLERRPLHGRRVVVTRARAQASGLAKTLRDLGAEVVELPAIRIEPTIESDEVRSAVERIGEYALIVLTSPNGVRLLFEAIAKRRARRTRVGQTRKAAGRGSGIGRRRYRHDRRGDRPGTARALAKCGISADIVPERFVAESLVESLAEVDVDGKRVLVARAAEARDVIPEHLEGRGAEVDVVALYETVREQPGAEAIEAAQAADYVTFTSSSTVRNLTEALGERFPERRPHRLDRPGHQRGRRRRRPRGRRRSRAPRHRRPVAALLTDAASG